MNERACERCRHFLVDRDGDRVCRAFSLRGNQFPGDDARPWIVFADDFRQQGAECGPDGALFEALQ